MALSREVVPRVVGVVRVVARFVVAVALEELPSLVVVADDVGVLRGRAADGRLAGPPRVVLPTEIGVRPTVGALEARSPLAVRAPSAVRVALVAVRPVGVVCGALRFTAVAPEALEPWAEPTAVRLPAPDTAAGRRCAVRCVEPRAFSLYCVPPRYSGDGL